MVFDAQKRLLNKAGNDTTVLIAPGGYRSIKNFLKTTSQS